MTVEGGPDEALGARAARREGARVRFVCLTCGSRHDVAVAQVVWSLKVLERGDEQTSVAGCAHLADHACVRCGGVRWEAQPCPDDERA
jgi:hypothetical protein